MTARERLLALRRALIAVLIARATLVGVALALCGVAIVRALALPTAFTLVASAIGIVAAVALGARARPARSLERIALWVEERHPSLRYALVTAAGDAAPGVETQALALPWWDDARRRLTRSMFVPVGALVAALMLFAWRPVLLHRGAVSSDFFS